MNKQQDIYEKIRSSAASVTPPEQLSPERIKEQLKRAKKPAKPAFPFRAWAAAAAAVVLFAGTFTAAHALDTRLNPGPDRTTQAAEKTAPSADFGTESTGPSAEKENIKDQPEPSAELLKQGNDAIAAMLSPAQSYAEIESAYRTASASWRRVYYMNDIMADGAEIAQEAESARIDANTSAKTEAASDEDAAVDDYSGTNLRTEGVDEADLVKTDGTCIYTVTADKGVTVIKANDGAPEVLTTLLPQVDDGRFQIRDIFLQEQTLIILGDAYLSSLENGTPENSRIYLDDVMYINDRYETLACFYDMTDAAHPKETGRTTLDGSYFTSRLVDGTLYLFSRYQSSRIYPFYDYAIADEETTYAAKQDEDSSASLPKMNGEVPDASCFYLPKELTDSDAFCMAAVPLETNGEISDSKVILGFTRDVYVSQDSIFLEKYAYRENTSYTNIVRLSYTDVKDHFTGKGTCVVPGELNDAFAIDEDKNGNLRVATTMYSWSENAGSYRDNRLYVFDDTLQEIGSLTGLAQNEDIKSARYIGDYLYLVTFQNTDPLFSIDLSDPSDPKVIGELEMPGFSEYLHPFGDGLLFGLGYNTDERTGGTSGLKLSMYDITNPADVKLLTNKYLTDADYAEALYNYKALTVTNDCVGFSADIWKNTVSDSGTSYYVFSYHDGTFTKRLEVPLSRRGISGARGIRIKDVFYVIGNDSITAYAMPEDTTSEFTKLQKASL